MKDRKKERKKECSTDLRPWIALLEDFIVCVTSLKKIDQSIWMRISASECWGCPLQGDTKNISKFKNFSFAQCDSVDQFTIHLHSSQGYRIEKTKTDTCRVGVSLKPTQIDATASRHLLPLPAESRKAAEKPKTENRKPKTEKPKKKKLGLQNEKLKTC